MTSPHATISWHCQHFNDLSPSVAHAIFQARNAVFVVEQNCVYQDIDGKDPLCHHLFALDQQARLLAYLRIVPAGLSYAEPSLGRVLTTQAGRGAGVGKELLQQGISHCQQIHGETAIRISAQAYLEKFYATFGFTSVSELYLEDDIPHLEMLKP